MSKIFRFDQKPPDIASRRTPLVQFWARTLQDGAPVEAIRGVSGDMFPAYAGMYRDD
jgi:hypothetical protein